jgi:hypothetical protein
LSLEEDLVAFLQAVSPPGHWKTRNIQIVRYFYGFDDATWPTLDSTAERFGLGSRERVRQILNTALRDHVQPDALPRLQAAVKLLASRSFWLACEFREALSRKLGREGAPSLPGLLHLMADAGMAAGYDLYDHNLERLTRSHLTPEASSVLARIDSVPELKTALQDARRLSGRLGLANTAYLGEADGPDAAPTKIRKLLRLDPNCWFSAPEGEAWYALESRDNALVGLAAKAFAVADRLSAARLAETLCNALRARSNRKPCPGRAEVEAWIRGSRYFAHEGERVRFRDAPGKLTAVEQELVSYLSTHERCDYKAIKAHLQSRGVVQSLIPKAATQSPLVYVDRSGGFKSYSYSLIGPD